LGHGIWTHALLQSLAAGKAVTTAGLRDDLADAVPRYLREHTDRIETQTPSALLSGDGAFELVGATERPAAGKDTAALGPGAVSPDQLVFRRITGQQVRTLPGFTRGRHYEPDRHSDSAHDFVAGFLTEEVASELQRVYQATKTVMKLRRRNITKTVGQGSGTIDTEAFRYAIESGQDPADPARAQLIRSIRLRVAPSELPATFDTIFVEPPDQVVIKRPKMPPFDDLVDLFEDLQETDGGDLFEDDRTMAIRYTSANGLSFSVDFAAREVILESGRRGCLALLADVSERFARLPTGPAQSLID